MLLFISEFFLTTTILLAAFAVETQERERDERQQHDREDDVRQPEDSERQRRLVGRSVPAGVRRRPVGVVDRRRPRRSQRHRDGYRKTVTMSRMVSSGGGGSGCLHAIVGGRRHVINTSTVSSNSCFDRRIFPACDHDGDGGGLRAALRYTALESVVTSAGEDGRLSRMLLPGGR